MIDIISVGKQKITYKNHSELDFEPLSFYLNLAQKTISKFAGNFSSSLAKEMLSSEDAIANVANCIMMADWRWDQDREGLNGQKKNKYSYRNQCAIWAIKSYMTRKKQKYARPHSIDIQNIENEDSMSLLDIINSNTKTPYESLVDHEKQEDIKNLINKILLADNMILSDRQIDCIKLYYIEGKTFSEIGKTFGITREAVRQNIKKSLSKIRAILN